MARHKLSHELVGFHFLDTTNVFLTEKDSAFNDEAHLTDRGSELLARALSDEIFRKKLL